MDNWMQSQTSQVSNRGSDININSRQRMVKVQAKVGNRISGRWKI